jgi:hypothetical protein
MFRKDAQQAPAPAPAAPPAPRPAQQVADASVSPFPAGTSTMLTSSQGLAGLGDTTKKQLLGS